MQFAVILGYVIASIFALCGIVNSVLLCLDGRELSTAALFPGLVIAVTPLAAASVILLLIQILCRLEQLVSAKVAGARSNRPERTEQRVPRNTPRESLRKEPEHFFPVHAPAVSDSEQHSEPEAEVQGSDNNTPEEKLRFFKLH